MKIWVDADACPGAVRDIILRAALKREIETVFVANKPLNIGGAPLITTVKVDLGPDVADAYLVEHARAGDLVISQDIPLAALLVEKGVVVISPYGTLFTESNIGEKLSNRDFFQELRDTGMNLGGPRPFGEKDKREFANVFDQALTRLLPRNGDSCS